MTRKHLTLLSFLLLCMTLGCASIFEGKVQPVTFNSQPSGAQIIINGMPMGVTPTTLTLKRSDYDKANVIFKKEGHQDQQATMQTKVTGWFWGNIISGGLLGSATDAITGAMWEYSPNNYFVTLAPSKASSGEMARLDYENMVRMFILFNHEQLASDLARGGGESLASLYVLVGVDEYESRDAFTTLMTLVSQSESPPHFAEAILNRFLIW